MNSLARRNFIKKSAIATAGVITLPNIIRAEGLRQSTVNIGFIGTGLRGRNHVNNILDQVGVNCVAICDIDPDAVRKTQELFKKKGKPAPKVYTGSDQAYLQMLETENLDGVIIATNWRWHTPICIAAMKAKVYAGVEVSGAFSVDECWELVNTHEETGTPLFFLENVNYRRDVMAVMNMVRDNIFGEIIHCRGGYQHDLRGVKFDDGNGGLVYGADAVGEARWRTEHSKVRNAELYPTHGLGPINLMLDINRGNRLTTVASHATKSAGLNKYIMKHKDGGENHPYSKTNWALGDIVTSTITTALGQTIILTHDTNLPRPYSLGFRVQGVEGLAEFDYHTRRIHVEGQSKAHSWDDGKEWLEKYDHKLWKTFGEEAVDKGHGGMDFFLDRAFVACVKDNKPAIIDVYDAATLRVITPLSEASIRAGGMPQEIPDFTEGKWMSRKPVFGLGEY
jgi:predicted dehydrogenase